MNFTMLEEYKLFSSVYMNKSWFFLEILFYLNWFICKTSIRNRKTGVHSLYQLIFLSQQCLCPVFQFHIIPYKNVQELDNSLLLELVQ